MSAIWAETDLLREESFAEFVEHMTGVIDRFEAMAQSIVPIADSIRGETDEKIVKSANTQIDELRLILVSLRGLSVGDAGAVDLLGQLLAGIDEVNAEIASGWSGKSGS